MARGGRKQPAMQGKIRSNMLNQPGDTEHTGNPVGKMIGMPTEGVSPVMKGKVGMQVKEKQSPIKRGDGTMNTLDEGRGKGR